MDLLKGEILKSTVNKLFMHLCFCHKTE